MPGRAFVVGHEGDAHVTVVEDRVVVAVGLVDLVQGLRHQERAHAVAGHEGQRRFEEVERPSAGNSSSISSNRCPGAVSLDASSVSISRRAI